MPIRSHITISSYRNIVNYDVALTQSVSQANDVLLVTLRMLTWWIGHHCCKIPLPVVRCLKGNEKLNDCEKASVAGASAYYSGWEGGGG